MTENARQFERIYLTDADYYEEGDGPVLWCYERIRDDDIEYVNVAAFDAQAARIAELEAMTPESWLDYDDEEATDGQETEAL